MKHAFVRVIVCLCLCLLVGAALAKPGDSQNLGQKDWNILTRSIVAIGGKIYIGRNGDLWVVEKNGAAKALPIKGTDGWGRTRRMATLNGKIYCINEETLYEVEPNGRAKKLTSDWRVVAGMAALDGKLYAIDSEELFEVDPRTGEYKSLSEGWYNVDGMVELGGKLYILRRDTLTEVDRQGNAKELAGNWNDASAMVAADGKLYMVTYTHTQPGDKLINEHVLESFDPKSGTRTRLTPPKGWDRSTGVSAMVALDDRLYIFQPGSKSAFLTLALK